MSNEQPRQFTYPKVYAKALASRRPLGQRGEPPRREASPLGQRNCLAMSNEQ